MIARWREWLVLAVALALVYGGMYWWRSSAEDRWAQQIASAAHPGDIVMYSTQSCVFCAKARAWFDAHRIPYVECDVERDTSCRSRYQALGAAGTPTFEVIGTRLLGFSPESLALALQRPRPSAASGAQP